MPAESVLYAGKNEFESKFKLRFSHSLCWDLGASVTKASPWDTMFWLAQRGA